MPRRSASNCTTRQWPRPAATRPRSNLALVAASAGTRRRLAQQVQASSADHDLESIAFWIGDPEMTLTTLQDLFAHELKDIYSGEKQLLRALPKMAKAATSEDLKAAFEEHLEVTRGQVERLEEIFSSLEIGTRGPKCEGMAGL